MVTAFWKTGLCLMLSQHIAVVQHCMCHEVKVFFLFVLHGLLYLVHLFVHVKQMDVWMLSDSLMFVVLVFR